MGGCTKLVYNSPTKKSTPLERNNDEISVWLHTRMSDIEALEIKLEELRTEHRDLDDVIARVAEGATVDRLQVQRLKKRKLQLKDQIGRIESLLVPDIIA